VNKHYPETDEDEFSVESIFRTDQSDNIPDPHEAEAEETEQVIDYFR
jgi:hypothetical protein